ncbi:MAG TPA: hypothetical protein VMV86_02175 [Methanosarcinales archaeon]|nr:hypothetical protein [Methanosarcinales archaeon]
MAKRELKNVVPVNNYDAIHPALDFFDGRAIISVGCKWQETYSLLNRHNNETSEEVVFTNQPYCIMSDGEKFRYSKSELANRKLFYSGKIELPEQSRWDYDDIHKYSENATCMTFPELYKLINDEYKYYLDFPDERYHALMTCFVIYTYFYPMFFNAPVLQFWGEMRTGKTKNLAMLEAMVFNPVNSANISSASVFRLVESRRATILFDESEDLMTADRSREIRNMLLAGTGKSGETYRQEKGADDNYKTQAFRVFSPKVIAHITGIDAPALLSRVIRITTTATHDKDKDNRCVELEDDKWHKIRNELYRACLGNFAEVFYSKDCLTESKLTGRTLYIWQGILTIAGLVSKTLAGELIELAVENRDEIASEIEMFNEEPDEMIEKLIELASDGKEYYAAEDVWYQLRGFGLSSIRDLGIRLGKMGLKSRNIRIDGKQKRRYCLMPDKLQKLLRD